MQKTPTSAWSAVWRVKQFMQSEQRIGSVVMFPAHVAKSTGLTRLEAELCLRLMCAHEMAERRDDGRYYLTEK